MSVPLHEPAVLRRLILSVVAAAALAAAALTAVSSSEPSVRGRQEVPKEVGAFFRAYVAEDGRVVRRDHGGDTVSEGQAYALLLAVAAGDRDRFDAVWRWTERFLQRPDGALAWRWDDGRVVDDEIAPDADVDAAHALTIAAERFDDDRYLDAARHVADGAVGAASVRHGDELVLAAGGWARQAPVTVNPSYASPAGFVALRQATHDARWTAIAASSRRILAELTATAPHLPPDWAALEGGARPAGAPGTDEPPTFGLDAARALVRHAVSCDRRDRDLAARAWPFLRDADLRARHRLDGGAESRDRHPVVLVGAAAAAGAAGGDAEMRRLLAAAGQLQEEHPSYYGGAWVALGRLLLTTDLLGRCHP